MLNEIERIVHLQFFVAEFYDILRIDKFKSQLFCQDERIEIFASRCGVILCNALVDARLDLIENGIYIEIQIQRAHDIFESFAHDLERLCAVAFFKFFVEARIKSVRHFDVRQAAFSGRGNNDILSLRIALYDVDDARNRLAVRHRRSAEFANFHIVSLHYFMRLLLQPPVQKHKLFYSFCFEIISLFFRLAH